MKWGRGGGGGGGGEGKGKIGKKAVFLSSLSPLFSPLLLFPPAKPETEAKHLNGTVEPRYNERPRDLAKSVRQNKVSLTRGSFPYILLLLRQKKSFVIPKTSLYRGSLYRGSTISNLHYGSV